MHCRPKTYRFFRPFLQCFDTPSIDIIEWYPFVVRGNAFAIAELNIQCYEPDYLLLWLHARFNSVSGFTDYVERAKLLSHDRCNVDVQPDDRLLTLSTCTGREMFFHACFFFSFVLLFMDAFAAVICYNNQSCGQEPQMKEGFYVDDPIGSQLLLQLILILTNAFFASTETAIASLNENRIRKQAEEGDSTAQKLVRMIESPTRYLSAIQVCITLSGFLASAFASDRFATPLAAKITEAGFAALSPAALHTVCVVLVTLILSYFMIVLGELVPKRLALQSPEKAARFSCGVIGFVSGLFLPLAWLLSLSTNIMLRLFGIDPNENPEEVTEEEIRMMVDIGSESGAIEQDERAMIENIFEFNNSTAIDIMVHRMDVVALQADATDEEILQTIRESGLSRFPVYGEHIDDIMGVLTSRDFLLNLHAKNRKTTRQLLRKPYLVPGTVPADKLFNNMQKQKVHFAVVVDEYGGMRGIVTMEDLLEEIVGNIYDEFDPKEELEIEKLEDNLWRVKGTVDLKTLSEELEIELPLEEDYDTLGGMVFSTFASIPEEGSKPEVTLNGLHVQVESILDHRVEKALVSIVIPEPEEETAEEEAAEEESEENE